jgi:hypothetical protein
MAGSKYGVQLERVKDGLKLPGDVGRREQLTTAIFMLQN